MRFHPLGRSSNRGPLAQPPGDPRRLVADQAAARRRARPTGRKIVPGAAPSSRESRRGRDRGLAPRIGQLGLALAPPRAGAQQIGP